MSATQTARTQTALRGLVGAAVLVAVLTGLARLAGFGRQLVLNATVGQTGLGTAYTTANYVPNIVFDVVAGGALASLVVPVLAGPLARAAATSDTEEAEKHRADASRTASALLSWTVVVLLPFTVAGVLLARPLTRLLLGGLSKQPHTLDTATTLLLLFLPQVLLYGVAVVTAGVLQAHRRFFASSLAPLLSSLVVAGAYVLFAACYHTDPNDLVHLPGGALLLLGLGTTAGVLALAACTVLPLHRTGLRLRPTLRFPDGVGPRVRALALAGAATLVAQQLTTVLVLVLCNGHGTRGAAVAYQNAWMVYVLPYAVLAVPIATSAFPRLSAAAHEERGEEFTRTAAASTRAVLLASCAGAVLLAASAEPVARFFALISREGADPTVMARALVAFAPGLAGYGLVAHLGRTLYAMGRGRASAWSVVAGWAVVAAVDVAVVPVVPAAWTVAALGLGNSVGMSVSGVLLLAATRRAAGPDAVDGCVRVAVAGLAAAAVGGAAGTGVAHLAGTGTTGWTLAVGVVAALVGAVVFAAVVAACGDEVRTALPGRLARRLGRAVTADGEGAGT